MLYDWRTYHVPNSMGSRVHVLPVTPPGLPCGPGGPRGPGTPGSPSAPSAPSAPSLPGAPARIACSEKIQALAYLVGPAHPSDLGRYQACLVRQVHPAHLSDQVRPGCPARRELQIIGAVSGNFDFIALTRNAGTSVAACWAFRTPWTGWTGWARLSCIRKRFYSRRYPYRKP